MELFTPMFWSALMSIIVIDLVLAGDNAIVIGMSARSLPRHLQLKAILWGTVGAIVIRITATGFVVWLLRIPGLLLFGGILLIWIAYRLLVQKRHNVSVRNETSIWSAIRTIVIADAIMGLDNVLAIAGASHGNLWLVMIGLLLSIPIIIWGSTLIIKWIERFPSIMYIGAAILAFTAGKMITDEAWFGNFFITNPAIKWAMIAIITFGVTTLGIKNNAEGTL